jgi:eukaryotic-like serine/threonine-protein kinase
MVRSTDRLWARWVEVDHIFEMALDRPRKEREGFVEEVCRGDPELLTLVRSLLAHHAADTLTGPGASLVRKAWALETVAPEPVEPGQRVGKYRVIRELGAGGTATVYQAERADGTFHQLVAIKLLRRGVQSQDVVRRFLAERRILSSLEHPHIARLLDGGATEDGRPYLVMELVAGESITAWADHRLVPVRDRLELFLQVVDAVQFAHRRLVIHRDLKPSNVLVDDSGSARLLDFGIAKLLDPGEGGESETLTRTGLRPLTPAYASPEQVRGDRVTTASDVYQLGTLLYVLLAGRRPFSGRGAELEGAITAGRPPRPSDVVVSADPEDQGNEVPTGGTSAAALAASRSTTPDGLRRALRGDLDSIILKAMRVEPEERYGSADALADDVRRFLNGLPVRARRGSASYLARKFVRRHVAGVAAVAAVVVVSAGAAVALAREQGATARERDRAEAAATVAAVEGETARQATEFLTGLFRSSDPMVALGDTVSVLAILDRGAERIASELADQPAVRAALLQALGSAYSGLGRYLRADTLLRESLELHRSVHGAEHAHVAEVLALLGDNAQSQRSWLAADQYLHEELRVRTAAGDLADTTLVRLLARMGTVRRDLGDGDSARVLAQRAVTRCRETADTSGPAYLAALYTLAYVLRGAGALDSAEVTYKEVLRRQVRLLGPDHLDVAGTWNNLGFLLGARDDYGGAARSYDEALRILRTQLGEAHPTALLVQSNLAAALELGERFEEAEMLRRERIGAVERQWPEGHWRVGAAHAELGRFLVRRARAGEALALLDTAVESFTATIGAAHPWTEATCVWLGVALLLTGRGNEAEALLESGTARLREQAPLEGDVRTWMAQAADLLEAQGFGTHAAGIRDLVGGG